MRLFLFIIVAVYTCCINHVAAKEHPCANDALEQAKKLVRFHDEGNHQDNEIADGTRAIEVGPRPSAKGRRRV